MDNNNRSFQEVIVESEKLQQLFEFEKEFILRKKIHFSFVFIRYVVNEYISYEAFFEEINSQLRNSDFAFHHKEQQYVLVLLSISKMNEAKSFIKRLNSMFKMPIHFPSCIIEIANASHNLNEIIARGEEIVVSLEAIQQEPAVIQDFLTKQLETIKVSIVESNEATTSIFYNVFRHIAMPNIELQIRTFKDGLYFIESDWHLSGHTHIVLLNDILPRKNGLEVLNYLRALPNEQKYLILFVSTKVSEEAQLQCFEQGADAYFVRPFNLRIFETQIKNYLRRLS